MSDSLNNDIPRNLAYQSNFKILFTNLDGIEYACTSISFPGINIGAPKTPTQMLTMPHEGDHIEFEPLTVTFLIDEEYKNYFELYERIVKMSPVNDSSTHESLEDGTVLGDAKLIILSNNLQPIKTIRFEGIIPTNLSGFELNVQDEEPQPVTATATFEYLKFEEETT